MTSSLNELALPDVEAMSAEDVLAVRARDLRRRARSHVLVAEAVVGARAHALRELGPTCRCSSSTRGYLFAETYETREKLVARYGLELIRPTCSRSPSSTVRRGRTSGSAIPTSAATSARSSRSSARSLDLDCWISGIRREQCRPGRTRSEARLERALRGLEDRTRSSTGTRSASSLHPRERDPVQPAPRRRAIASIGDPCTRPVRRGEDERAGRWAGPDKIECGIHGTNLMGGFIALVHRPLGRGEDDDREHRRAGARAPRAARRAPRRRHRAHAPLEGARLLEGGPRHEHRAHRLGRVAPRARTAPR